MTPDEVRDAFLEHAQCQVDYWLREQRAPTTREKLEGLAFSIFAALDGSSYLPRFSVSPTPHPDDRAYHVDNGENWFPESGCDISGSLHERWCQLTKREPSQ